MFRKKVVSAFATYTVVIRFVSSILKQVSPNASDHCGNVK